jgi:hypothetical protein
MNASCEEREVEIEVLGIEHPFVVLRLVRTWLKRDREGKGLTMDIDKEKRYHNPISNTLIKLLFTTL